MKSKEYGMDFLLFFSPERPLLANDEKTLTQLSLSLFLSLCVCVCVCVCVCGVMCSPTLVAY